MTKVESTGADLRKLEAALADARSAVIAVIVKFATPEWPNDPDAIATLELAKTTLTPKQRTKLNRILARRSELAEVHRMRSALESGDAPTPMQPR